LPRPGPRTSPRYSLMRRPARLGSPGSGGPTLTTHLSSRRGDGATGSLSVPGTRRAGGTHRLPTVRPACPAGSTERRGARSADLRWLDPWLP
jgi:hypothetical protein